MRFRPIAGLVLCAAFSPLLPAQPADLDREVEAMLRKLPLEQKLDLIACVDAEHFVRAVPEIGLPALKKADGPMGVRNWGPSTAYAGGIALAAAWDSALAERVGASVGRDARARGVHVLLGPGVNIYRLPVNGRNFEYFGEDPFLASRLAVGYIRGVQGQGVVAMVKHFAANNSEYDRMNTNSIVDERTLREIYLPAFEAAVKEGRVAAVMDSYNRINGAYATENPVLNLQILKGEWGFGGILVSDGGATHDGIVSANSGLDLDNPSGRKMNRATLLPAVRSGQVSVATIDDKVRRILRVALEFHFLSRAQLDPGIPLYNQKSRQVALESAQESPVLLKNEGGLLPLDPARTRRLALIGPNAYPAVVGGGGSSEVAPFSAVSLLTGLSDFLGAAGRVTSCAGLKTLPEIFAASSWSVDPEGRRPGLREQIFPKVDFTGDPRERVAAHVEPETFGAAAAEPAVRFSGYFIPKRSGPHLFVAAGLGLAGPQTFRLWIDGRPLLELMTKHPGLSPQVAELQLQAGKPVSVRFDCAPATSRPELGLGVIARADLVDPRVKTLAAAADAVVVAVGFNDLTESEAFDRTYRLPLGQDELIRAVLDANPRTIVVLNAGGGVDTSSWIARVPAFLHAFYGGQESGRALAQIIFGQVDPSGHLPMSFERRIEDNPAFAHYYEKPGSVDVVYGEGLFLGYRYYDRAAVKPLFPFGFGLSYTSFAFSDLAVTPADSSADGPVTVSFQVRNTGGCAGAEVAQIYVGDPSATVERPLRELKGFERVALEPGEARRISVALDRRAFAYWDVRSHGWKVDPGEFTIAVGDSSANLPLHTEISLH